MSNSKLQKANLFENKIFFKELPKINQSFLDKIQIKKGTNENHISQKKKKKAKEQQNTHHLETNTKF